MKWLATVTIVVAVATSAILVMQLRGISAANAPLLQQVNVLRRNKAEACGVLRTQLSPHRIGPDFWETQRVGAIFAVSWIGYCVGAVNLDMAKDLWRQLVWADGSRIAPALRSLERLVPSTNSGITVTPIAEGGK